MTASAPTSLVLYPVINAATNGVFLDNGNITSDGNGQITIGKNNKYIQGTKSDGTTAQNILGISAANNTHVVAVTGQSVKLTDNTNDFAIISAALANILSTALQFSVSPTIPTPTGSAQTIATNTGIISRTAPSGACTNAILQAGTVNGQIVIVTNENVASTTNTITFNTTIATSNVINDGTNPQVIKCGTAKAFIWLSSLNGGNGAWVSLAPFGG
jgi:hypothetical protein